MRGSRTSYDVYSMPVLLAVPNEWVSITALVATTVFTLAGLVFAVGYGFGIKGAKNWARNEFYQAIASLILMTMVVLALALAEQVAVAVQMPDTAKECSCTGGQYMSITGAGLAYECAADPPPYSAAFDKVLCFLIDKRDYLWLNVQTTMAVANVVLGIALSTKWSMAPHQAGLGFAPFSGAFPIMDLTNLVALFANGGMLFLWGQIIILNFVRTKFFLLLPVAFALRAFPFTRGAGAALMALIIGMYAVFPLLIVFEIPMVEQDIADFGIMPSLTSIAMNPLTILSNITEIGQRALYFTAIIAVFLPVLNFTLTFTFTRELALLLGGDIDVSALAKLL